MESYRNFDLLAGVDAKIRRAREHLDVLKSILTVAYAEPKAARMERGLNGQVSIWVDHRPDPDACAAAGDAIQNMRSALDHLVWDLVLLAEGKPGAHTSFPVHQHPNDFRVRAFYGAGDRPPQLYGLKPRSRAVRMIVAVQPYYSRDPTNFWLTLLFRFSNHDKHRSIYSFGNIPRSPQEIQKALTWNPEATLLDSWVIDHNTAIEGPTEVLRLTFDKTGPSPEVEMQRQFALVPVFSDSTKMISYGVMDAWHYWLTVYVDMFRELFD